MKKSSNQSTRGDDECESMNDCQFPRLHSKYLIDVPTAIHELVEKVPLKLPKHYEPGDYDVVCGRGKGKYNRAGNKMFRSIVAGYVDEYASAKTKADKTSILAEIVENVCQQDNGNAKFIMFDSKEKCWCVLREEKAREKAGHAIRQCLKNR